MNRNDKKTRTCEEIKAWLERAREIKDMRQKEAEQKWKAKEQLKTIAV